MIRTAVATSPTRPARTLRAGVTLASAAGIALLAGCAPSAANGTQDQPTDTGSTGSPSTNGTDSTEGAAYADGTYTAEGSYATPETVETITVTVTLESDVITAVEVVGAPQKAESEQYQGEFIGGISEVVVGEDIDEISVSRVAGSSLTSGGFNDAIDAIKAEAAV